MLKPAFAPAIAGRCLRREFMNNLIWRSVTCRPGKKSVLPKGKTEPCSRRRYRQTRPEGRSPPLRGCLRSGYARPSTPPQRHSHPVCRAILTLIVALDLGQFLDGDRLRDGLPLLRRPPAARLGRGNMESRLLGPNPLGAMHVGDEGLVRVLQSPQKARLLAITGVDAHPSEPHPPGARPAHDVERMLAL